MKKVITYGTYDLFHEGHYKLLERAKALGDYLIVGVTTEHFDEMRGKVNVIDSIMTRIENVRATGFADEIIVEDHEGQKIEDIQKYGVDIFTLGSDWVGAFDYLKQFCEVVYLDRTANISSTKIRNDSFKLVRMGIVGTGRIVPRFLTEAKYVSGVITESAFNPTKDYTVDTFSKKTGIEVFTEDYNRYLENVDAIYIAAPNEFHYEYAKKALEAGKHVLCEKPVALTKEEAQELYDYADSKGLILLEMIKTAYCPGFQQLLNVAQSGKIGEIRDVEATFTRLADTNSRERCQKINGGAFMEFASYNMLPIMKLLGCDYEKIHIDSLNDENGIDVFTKVFFRYKNAMATAKMGVGVKSEGQLLISGTKGYIIAESPWWLTKKFMVRYENPTDIEVYEPKFMGDGLRYAICEFISTINGHGHKGYKLTTSEALAMADVTEEFLKFRGDK